MAAQWLNLASSTHENIDDINTIMATIIRKKKEDEFIGKNAQGEYDFDTIMETRPYRVLTSNLYDG
jgi:hypothetical protein